MTTLMVLTPCFMVEKVKVSVKVNVVMATALAKVKVMAEAGKATENKKVIMLILGNSRMPGGVTPGMATTPKPTKANDEKGVVKVKVKEKVKVLKVKTKDRIHILLPPLRQINMTMLIQQHIKVEKVIHLNLLGVVIIVDPSSTKPPSVLLLRTLLLKGKQDLPPSGTTLPEASRLQVPTYIQFRIGQQILRLLAQQNTIRYTMLMQISWK